MGTALVILILVLLIMPGVWRWSRAWLLRRLQRKATDYFFRQAAQAAGVDPDSVRGTRTRGRGSGAGYSRRASERGRDESIIPREYAEDIEFTEIHEYSSETEIGGHDDSGVSYRCEEQVEEAQIIEISEPRDNQKK